MWPEIEEAIERLRPLASDALLAIFQQRMGGQIEPAFGDITRRLSGSGIGAVPTRGPARRAPRALGAGARGWGKRADEHPRIRDAGLRRG